jgi:hypothetical protein
LEARFEIERWPLAAPFRISGYTFEAADVLVITVDLDGPIFLQADRASSVRYDDGFIMCPQTLWG